MAVTQATRTTLKLVQKYHPKVTKVVDATKQVRVTITADDCRRAKKGAPSQCAMARAFNREWDGSIISKSVSYLIKGTTAYRFQTPESVVREIVSFDRHKDFRPGNYGLNVPAPSMALGNWRMHSKLTKTPAPVFAPSPAGATPTVHEMKPVSQKLGKRHGMESPGGHKPAAGVRKYIHKTDGVRSL